jgi:hypothetical protein
MGLMSMVLPALSPFSPLGNVLGDISRAIEAKLYYPALLVSLTIPEICSGLMLDRSTMVKEKHYVAFINNYTKPNELGLSGLECYRLRGGLVHRANLAGHPKLDYTHVIFTLPTELLAVHGIDIEGNGKKAVCLDLRAFCGAMRVAAEKWFQDHGTNTVVVENMRNLISFRPNGVQPFFGGNPVVASGE